MENGYKPTRIDHFPACAPGQGSRKGKASERNQGPALKDWLTDRGLKFNDKRPDLNVRAMQRATGGRAW